jgi:hypothetical protein
MSVADAKKVCPELESYALDLDTPRRVWY